MICWIHQTSKFTSTISAHAGVPNSAIHHNWLHDSVKTGLRYDAPVANPEVAGIGGLVHHNVLWNFGIGVHCGVITLSIATRQKDYEEAQRDRC